MDSSGESGGPRQNLIALLAGPLLAGTLVFVFDLQPDNPAVTRMAAIALWMAIWWISEAVPLAVTALLPVVLFPLMHIMSGKQVAPLYFNNVIFLFIGGFIIAIAMQRWNLHRRIALAIINMVGLSPGRLMLGFMLAAAFLSMWISNTATTMMMVPIALAVVFKLEENRPVSGPGSLGNGILLAIAYAASIGGIATLVGTPPNLSFVRIYAISFPEAAEISFAQWMAFALPLCVVMFGLTWALLSYRFARGREGGPTDVSVYIQERGALGPISSEERAVLIVFVLTAILWLGRSDLALGSLQLTGWASRLGLSGLADDGTVAILMALLLFIIPSRRSAHGRLLNWEDLQQLPWGIVLLFGGGFALASGFMESGLSAWCGERLAGLAGLNPVIIVLAICLIITFLTELTSNTATTEMILPIMAATAVSIGVDPLLLMVPATISASCAFMLPVATPPNAIVFGSGRLSIREMAQTGLILNLIGAVLITALIFLLGGPVLGIH